MAWYRAGTVTVANGSPTVTGVGTDFVANAQIGHAFLGPDGKVYEIDRVEAAGQIVLTSPYLGGSGGGQGYAIMPTSSFARDLALGAAQLLNSFAEVRDGIGAGLMQPGTNTAPGLRFANDPDTGLMSTGPDAMAVVLGTRTFARFSRFRMLLDGPDYGQNGTGADREYGAMFFRAPNGGYLTAGISGVQTIDRFQDSGALCFHTAFGVSREVGRFDEFGNLLINVASGAQHTIAKDVGQGSLVLNVLSKAPGAAPTAVFAGVNSYTPNGSGAALYLGRSDTTGRSVNAGGTLNASGADYAEYMFKAVGCGTIAKGDACGVDRDGHLTKTWADAISFVIKSTDPSYVGGDIWGQSVGPRPEGPGKEPAAPIAPPAEPASEDEADVEAWRAIVVAYPAQLAAYQAAHEAWADAKAAHDTALLAWEAALEAERQKVDRIAFSGQVPVNVTGDFAVGDYLIAAAAGAGIKAVAVPAHTITFDQYRRRLGKVWAVRDGRAWVDVQHG